MCKDELAEAPAQGEMGFAAIAVVANSDKSALQRGACCQVPAEFNRAVKIVASTTSGRRQEFSLSDLPRPKRGLLESSPHV